ncbi:hypothetical protein [Roseiterribacter gracilis]|uniref:Uncharacterized protein n=1 Tax=Roseiterribacter gracilis TaxID=2812848 RepID=A0A8S8XGU1_9PROT|nr:hypothetical protein TMPK1_29340 [Rhodospirillales bacterium TMPK1]
MTLPAVLLPPARGALRGVYVLKDPSLPVPVAFDGDDRPIQYMVEFARWLLGRLLAVGTISDRVGEVVRWLRWCGGQDLDPCAPDPQSYASYWTRRSKRADGSPRSRAGIGVSMRHLESFMEFCVASGRAPALPYELIAKKIRTPRGEIVAMVPTIRPARQVRDTIILPEPETFAAVVAALDGEMAIFLRLGLEAGVRTSEGPRVLQAWRCKRDLGGGDCVVTIRRKKRPDGAPVYVGADLARDIDAFLRHRRDRATYPSRFAIAHAIEEAARKVGARVTMTLARHAFASGLYQALLELEGPDRVGAPPLVVKEAMGHASLATSESYLDLFEHDVDVSLAIVPPDRARDLLRAIRCANYGGRAR